MENSAERLHAFLTAVVDGAARLYLPVVGKHLGVVLHHALGNATVLLRSQRRELAAVALGVFPYLLQASLYALAQFGKVFVVGKLLVHPLVTAVGRQPARTVAPVMRDIERLETFGSRRQFYIFRSMVCIVYTTPTVVFRGWRLENGGLSMEDEGGKHHGQ